MGSGERRRTPAAVEMCTESLGSESGYVGDAEIELPASPAPAPAAAEPEGEGPWFRRSPEKRRRTERSLPPAMRRPEAYMRSERRDGRLILTEVRIERHEVFHVSRADGRLRLRLVEAAGGADGASAVQEGDATNIASSNRSSSSVAIGGSSSSSGGGGGGGIGGGSGNFCQVAAAGGGGGGGGGRMMVVL